LPQLDRVEPCRRRRHRRGGLEAVLDVPNGRHESETSTARTPLRSRTPSPRSFRLAYDDAYIIGPILARAPCVRRPSEAGPRARSRRHKTRPVHPRDGWDVGLLVEPGRRHGVARASRRFRVLRDRHRGEPAQRDRRGLDARLHLRVRRERDPDRADRRWNAAALRSDVRLADPHREERQLPFLDDLHRQRRLRRPDHGRFPPPFTLRRARAAPTALPSTRPTCTSRPAATARLSRVPRGGGGHQRSWHRGSRTHWASPWTARTFTWVSADAGQVLRMPK